VSLGIPHQGLEVRRDAARNALDKAVVDIGRNHVADVWARNLVEIRVAREATMLLDLLVKDLADIIGSGTSNNILVVAHGLLHGGQGSVRKLADLRERSAVANALDTGGELWQECSSFDRIVDELGEVLDDDDGLAQNLLGGVGRVEGPLEEGRQECQNRRRDDGDEGRH